ncbi:phosphoglycerate kinase [Desulfofustis limnaeus]|uniref:Phosphoglycerate kinase n=1 Tax=Desulfofustis limnaeus TaxID=2740163 RepID=A0ABM7WC91_9BACT|nr:phosphoglycerate kinase [Desulfofustis limnaeus]BDD88562.1 phosphoglycerate kinase [Desulfofustis limnaeus]
MKTIRDLDVQGKKVLVRVDFNVPMDGAVITDDIRIREAVPTLRYLQERGARLLICSHRGRPKGKRVDELSMAPVAAHLEAVLGCPVVMAPDCVGPEVERLAGSLADGEVVMLENLRFYEQETKNDPAFSAQLAALAEVYVNDAFAVSHRAHASVVGVPERVAEKAAGFLLQKEVEYFQRAMEDPVRPLAAVVGGAKVSSKLGVLEHILPRVDRLVIGGAMANTFLKSRGIGVGASLVEDDLLEAADRLLKKAAAAGVKVYLPVDFVVAEQFDADAVTKNVTYQDIPNEWLALDIGPATVAYFIEALADARTVVWNGPMGAFEMDPFARGTMALAQAIASGHALSITGGGDSNAAIKKAGVATEIGFMSTGGGAFLEMMEGKILPGIAALTDQP